MFSHWTRFVLSLSGACLIGLASCKREERSFRSPPAFAGLSEQVTATDPIRPGPSAPITPSGLQPMDLGRASHEPFGLQFPQNAGALSEGQTLYSAFNCVGCHSHGGGGMGPPLLDRKWLYGSEPDAVYLSIVQGRPNGMPSFRGRITDIEVWKLVAYVRSLSGQANTNAAAGREDHMTTQPPPNSIPFETPLPAVAPTTKPAAGESKEESHS